jgi:multiple sugar transport system permease protein
MSVALTFGQSTRRRRYRLRRVFIETASVILGIALVIWSLLPVYNMALIALDPEGDNEFAGYIWPPDPTLESIQTVLTEGSGYVAHFWHQLGNSLYLGLMTMILTVVISSLASFAVGRMRLIRAWLLTDVAMLTYLLPASFLAIPFLRVTQNYGLSDSLWAVIAAEVMFATPFAILVLQRYAKLIPMELDEAARVDGASPVQVYLYIYLPLTAPALVAVGTFALLLTWYEYVYQYLLISSTRNWTVAIALEQFYDVDDSPWNQMMATAMVYALPPVAIFYALRRYMVAGLTLGGVKG